VQVRLLNPAPPPPIVVGEVDPNKLLAKYLPITFVEEDLADYLKEPSGKEILKVSRSRSPSVAMVVFSGVPGRQHHAVVQYLIYLYRIDLI